MIKGFKDFYKKELYKELEEKDIRSEILDKYEFKECIARTQSSTTYVALHKIIKKKYIVKIYENSNQAMEYKVLSDLNHKGIPMITDVFEDKDSIIIIEEYFEGKTLKQVIDEREHIDKDETINIFCGICEVLKYLHDLNPPIIHKDIKPENVMITKDDEIKLIDFGCARNQKENQSKDTVLLGTQGYAAPEQYGFKQTDCRTDIYTLGILMDEIITRFNVNLENKYIKIINKCKELDPNNRYNAIDEIINEIKEIQKPIYKKRNTFILFTAIILLTITGIFVFISINSTDIYNFKSEIVAQAVSISLSKSIDKITYEDLSDITEISIWGEKILGSDDTLTWESNIGDYVSSYTVNGKRYLKRGGIDTLEDFKYMQNLKTLSIVKQNIKGITPISKLNLVHLYLNDNYIEDISSLSEMTSLYTLEIGGNPVGDIEVLSNFNNLGELDISDTKCMNFNVLSGLYSLKMLLAKNLNIKSVDFLTALYNIEYLNLEYNDIEDIYALKNLNNLVYLNIANNPVKDISVINLMENMKSIVIRNTKIDRSTIDSRIEIREN